jgi:hypothetical protein
MSREVLQTSVPNNQLIDRLCQLCWKTATAASAGTKVMPNTMPTISLAILSHIDQYEIKTPKSLVDFAKEIRELQLMADLLKNPWQGLKRTSSYATIQCREPFPKQCLW